MIKTFSKSPLFRQDSPIREEGGDVKDTDQEESETQERLSGESISYVSFIIGEDSRNIPPELA